MPFHRRAQDRTVATFLEASRIHFDLNPPRSHAGSQRWFAGPHMRSLLIAGSLGALFGGPARLARRAWLALMAPMICSGDSACRAARKVAPGEGMVNLRVGMFTSLQSPCHT